MPGLRQAADGASGNAESKAESTAEGSNTHGIVNQHPAFGINSDASNIKHTSSGSPIWPYRVGFAEDRNKNWRRTMEDAHSFVYNFGGVHGQGFFSIFDGHAGKHAAEWCGEHFHDYLIKAILTDSKQPVPDLLNHTFHNVDARLSQLAQEQGSSSGCTAVTCFLRLEDEDGKPIAFAETGGVNPQSSNATPRSSPNAGVQTLSNSTSNSSTAQSSSQQPVDGADHNPSTSSSQTPSSKSSSNDLSSASNSSQRRHSHSNSKSGSLLSSFAKRIRKASAGSSPTEGEDDEAGSSSKPSSPKKASPALAADSSSSSKNQSTQPIGPPSENFVQVASSPNKVRRVLYTANVGDARAVLCRRGHAIRLTYDHKASDAQEAKRITDAGGFVMNNRVNAVLAVTRSLGDSAMKEFVVGAPYTTETTLTDEDTFLIVACDGLWDVAEDQDAVDLVREVIDPQEAANRLLSHALNNFSTDNTSVMVIRFNIDGDAYCAKVGGNRKPPSNPSPPSAVQGSHRAPAGTLPHEDKPSTSVDGAGKTDHSAASSVADSSTSHTAQAGSTVDTQGAVMQPVRSNASNTSTVSNAGSGTS
ncbi:unnamed protein product [Sympodiomycopsis kandeliae]